MDLNSATKIANELVAYLAPACERLKVCGSVRRGKAEVHDLELIAIPKPRRVAVFGEKKHFATELDAALWKLVEREPNESILNLSPIKGGEKYKQFTIVGSDSVYNPSLHLDLFVVTPPAQWGVLYVIRTGPGEFSKWCVTPRAQGGALPDYCQVQDGRVLEYDAGSDDAKPLAMPEEQDFLDFLELGWLEPRDRKEQWGKFQKGFKRIEARQ